MSNSTVLMKSFYVKTLAFLFLVQSLRVGAQEGDATYYDWFHEHLRLGTRVTHFVLLDDERSTSDTFLGHINKLEDEQDYTPTKIFVDYLITPTWGFELTWDQVQARVVNGGDGSQDIDGTLKADGLILTFVGRYVNETRATPFAGIGAAFMNASFDEDDWWHLGYSSEADYIALGSPTKARNGKKRIMPVEDDAGLVVTGGVDYEVTDNFLLDFYVRYMNVSIDGEAQITLGHSTDTSATGSFDLENVALGAGAIYRF